MLDTAYNSPDVTTSAPPPSRSGSEDVVPMIKAPCPRCKHVSHMPDSAGGLIGRCKQCGAIVRIPLADTQRKYCSVCHVEISQAKRVKDEAGDYFCIPCWKA